MAIGLATVLPLLGDIGSGATRDSPHAQDRQRMVIVIEIGILGLVRAANPKTIYRYHAVCHKTCRMCS
jgi:hypothetical protein